MQLVPFFRSIARRGLNGLRRFHRGINITRRLRSAAVFVRGRLRALSMPNDKQALELLEKGHTSWLLLRLRVNLSGTSVGGVHLCDGTVESLYWVGMLPERIMTTLEPADRLMRLLAQVEPLLRRAVAAAPYFVDAHHLLARNLWMQGRYQEAPALFAEAEKARVRFAKAAGLNPDALLLLPENCAHILGLMGHLDAFFKHRHLTGDTRPYYLTAKPEDVVNDAFFGYWKDFLAPGVPDASPLDAAAAHTAWASDWNWSIPLDGQMMHAHTAIARIQRKWTEQGLPPLLRLNTDHEQELQKFRQTIGMRPHEWFVCLHVRSAAYYADSASQDFRNSPIEDYTPVIKAIVAAGGWVIRMGDPSTPPLDPSLTACDKVVDYAHHASRSSALDVALSATCRLFVATSSGLHTIAHAFGSRVCYVNIAIYAGFPWHQQCIFIPKLYYSDKLGRILSMDEILSSHLIHADHQHLFAKDGVRLVNNTPDEITETVLEALNAPDNSPAPPQFAALIAKNDLSLSPRLGQFFSEKWAKELWAKSQS